MKLISVQVTNFRSILDSGSVEIGATTCLVGKNEAGKTAFLKALEGLGPVDDGHDGYDRTECYPRRYLAEYAERHGDGEAEVVNAVWEMDKADVDALEDEFGRNAVSDLRARTRRSYGDTEPDWELSVNEGAVIEHLCAHCGLRKEDRAAIATLKSTGEIAEKIASLEEPSEAQTALLAKIQEYPEGSAKRRAVEIIERRTPEFLYFSHYDRMSGELAINQLEQDKAQGAIKEGDQVFLDFLEYAGTTLEELAEAKRFEEMNARCEAAANRITDQIFEYWTQNDQLEIEVRLDEGKPEDEPPFNSGPVARARVKNSLHRVTVPFSERSAGFIWFFSFLVKFAQIRKRQGNVIILLDEPGLTLHGTAQNDLLRYFHERLEPKHQLIYTTHSPFMVPAGNLASVRAVEDVTERDSRGRKVSSGTKIRDGALATAPQTNFPLLGAMGYELTQGLIIAPNTLLVEGPSDILYLQALSQKLHSLKRTHLDPKWAICPAGGIDKVLPFVRLFRGNDLNIVVLTDLHRGQRSKLGALYGSEILERERIILATEIAGQEEADIEDFFAPEVFCDVVNASYGLPARHKLTPRKLANVESQTDRLVKRAEAHFRLLPDTIPTFSHYLPALHLLRHPELLDKDTPALRETLDRFEAAFSRIARYA